MVNQQTAVHNDQQQGSRDSGGGDAADTIGEDNNGNQQE
jgi:hypothetical protein